MTNYNGSAEKAQAVQAEIEAAGGRAQAVQCNVSDYAACETFFQGVIETYGRIDILVNNAGITRDGLLARMTEEDFDRVIEVNLKGTFHCLRFAARQMIRQRGGRIINLASVSGVAGNAGQVNYAASKAGVIGMTKSAARELASRGVTVNAIAPGFIETDMTGALSDAVKEAAVRQIRKAGGDCGYGRIFGFGRGRLYYRPGISGRRRYGHVGGKDEEESRSDRPWRCYANRK